MTIQTKRRKPTISSYFKALGIKDYKSDRGFWKHVTEVDSKLAGELEPLMSREKEGNLYEVKNSTLPFSLAVESWTMSFHKEFLKWVDTRKQIQPLRILEIGCDNGLLSCWYALRFPNAKVVGIDKGDNGIQRAQELAKQMEVANVTFYQMDFTQLLEHFPEDHFDLIISVRSFHEIMGLFPIPQYWSLPDYLEEYPTFGNQSYIEILNHLLTEDGTYLSCDRLENPADVGKWTNLLRQANLHVQWEESDVISYHELGMPKRSPILLVTKQVNALSAWEGMEHLYTKGKPIVLEAGTAYGGAAAEFAYHRIGKKTFLTGIFLKVTDHWYLFRFEIWDTDNQLVVYSYGNMGHRHLDILPAGAYEEAELVLEENLAQYSHLGPVTRYNSLEERPE